MKYYIGNKLSKSSHTKLPKDGIDTDDLDKEFFKNLKADDEVVLYGGDGTINKFINKCEVYPQITIVPSGTGNDLARSLDTDFKNVSIFSSNDYKYVNGFDVGFGALVCKLVEEDKSKGNMSYFSNVYKGLKQTKMLNGTVTVDGMRFELRKTFLITAQNTPNFGGGMRITPNANIESDTVEVCIIGGASKYLIAAIFPTVFIGLHTKIKNYVKVYSGSNITIELDEPYISECDGEVSNENTSYNIEYVGKLKMRLKRD